jgi:Ca2+-binding EF-hand superfamily protein
LFPNFRELGENMTDEELRAMIDEFDRDGDGESKLCIDEIRKTLSTIIPIWLKCTEIKRFIYDQ